LKRRARGAYDEKGREEARERKALMRKYLRLPLDDFLSALSINETSEKYDEAVAIWREYHDE
jgi:hypothetical protein